MRKDDDNALEMLFTDIFHKHEFRLYTLAQRLTKSDLYAKDIIQEVFLTLWEHRNSIHTINNVEAWLYRVTENKIIDFLRKTSSDNRLREAVWNNLLKHYNDTEALVAAKEYDQVIQKAIDQLPPQRKLIYYLNREEGLGYQEIAKELHISRHTVKNQLSTALQSIRKFISKSARLFFLF
jgi:RNA polymerase sigma-70 factor (ECF subfamily)